MKRIFRKILLAAFAAAALACARADGFKVERADMPVWPEGKMPGADADKIAGKDGKIPEIKAAPSLSVYLPRTERKTGFMIICPGGGYKGLASDHEGVQIADWLSGEGIPCAILFYRVPDKPQAALMDIQRAIRLVRANAQKWNVDPSRIGIMGFSAGANLCARASTQFGKEAYAPIDAADSLSSRPDFAGLVYPAYCDKPGNDHRWSGSPLGTDGYDKLYALAENLNVSKDTPPTFIVQTQDDFYANAAIAYYLALKGSKVPANLHMFDKGGHGYGLRNKTDLVSEWKDLFEDWLKHHNFDGEKK